MTTSAWPLELFLESTRGHIVEILRRGPMTVLELSAELGLAANTVRTHLSNLERDQIVRLSGTRRGTGAGKPAHIFELTPETRTRFSRAYVPTLRALIAALTHRLDPDAFDHLMDDVGARLAPTNQMPATHASERLLAARDILENLGGVVTSAEVNGAARIECAGCPLSAVASNQPRVCRAMASLLSTALGVRVRPTCSHGAAPSCGFEFP